MTRLQPLLTVSLLALLFTSKPAWAKLNVVTTTTDLAALVREVGGTGVTVEAIAKGTQDPHFIEAKPSFMTKVSRADLVVAVGLDLEVGWLPSILRGARNPKVLPGNSGYLEVGPALNPIEVATGKVSRAEGDVHPFGNPHFWLDPVRAGDAAVLIGEKLATLDASHGAEFKARAQSLKTRLEQKTAQWRTRLEKAGVKQVITYHKTLNYFLDRFHIVCAATLEPKPGIPPTSGHILQIIQLMKAQKISVVLVENFFDPAVTRRLEQELGGLHARSVAVSVDGAPHVSTLEDLYESLVQALEGT